MLCSCRGFVSHARSCRGEIPSAREIARAALGQVAFHKQRMGLSDRTGGYRLSRRMDDVRSVIERSNARAAVIGVSEGDSDVVAVRGDLSRANLGLVLRDSVACLLRKPGYEVGLDPDFVSVNLH